LRAADERRFWKNQLLGNVANGISRAPSASNSMIPGNARWYVSHLAQLDRKRT